MSAIVRSVVSPVDGSSVNSGVSTSESKWWRHKQHIKSHKDEGKRQQRQANGEMKGADEVSELSPSFDEPSIVLKHAASENHATSNPTSSHSASKAKVEPVSHASKSNYEASLNPMQRHAAFFDRNQDGVITISESYNGLRAIGLNMLFAVIGTILVHFFLSYPTQESWLPDPWFRINVRRVSRTKHGSDSGVYDQDGEFHASRFHTAFDRFKKSAEAEDRTGMTIKEILQLVWHNAEFFDFFGIIANHIEWLSTFYIAMNENGEMSFEDIEGLYDGTLFYNLERRVAHNEIERKEKIASTWHRVEVAAAKLAKSLIGVARVQARFLRRSVAYLLGEVDRRKSR